MEEAIKNEAPVSAPKINYERVLELALEIGVGLLSSGGSVSRVETAVDRVCSAYGAEEVNVAAFPSMVIASIKTEDGHQYSYMKRVYATSNNLFMLEKYNQLSRDVCYKKLPVEEALKMSFKVAHDKPRNKWFTVLGASAVAGIYSVFFGGTGIEILPAFIIAFGMSMLNELLSKRSLNVYATTFLLSLIGGIFSILTCKVLTLCNIPCQGPYVMIGTIMILIPGLLTTNAVRDMFTGDLMSGTFQLLNGILLAVVIAAGYALAMLALRPLTDFASLPEYTGWHKAIALMVSGTFGAAAVCFFFNINLKRLGWAILASFLTLGLFVGMIFALPGNTFVYVLIPSFFAAMVSETLARFIKVPATIILVPSIIAVVPGSSLYYAMEAIVQGNMAIASTQGMTCLVTLLGLAVGICAATVIFRLISPVKLKYYKKSKTALIKRAIKYGQVEELAATETGAADATAQGATGQGVQPVRDDKTAQTVEDVNEDINKANKEENKKED